MSLMLPFSCLVTLTVKFSGSFGTLTLKCSTFSTDNIVLSLFVSKT